MTIKLTWVERNRRGEELSRREAFLHAQSAKEPTRNYVGRLIARHHPELTHVGKTHLIDSFEIGFRWRVYSSETGRNSWTTVYADPLVSEQLPALSTPVL